MSISNTRTTIKGKNIPQSEYKELKKKYWGQHLWLRGYFCRSVGIIMQETIEVYIENQVDEYEENFKIRLTTLIIIMYFQYSYKPYTFSIW